MEVKLPIGVRNLQPFRLLQEHFKGSAGDTLLIWYLLFQELLYRTEDGGPVGRVPVTEIPVFFTAFEDVAAGAKAQATLYQKLVEVKLLQVQGEDMVCPRFMSLHGGVSAASRTPGQTGGDMKAFNHKQKRSQEALFQQTLGIPPSVLVDGENNPLAPDTVVRLTRLIVACDNALFKPQRPIVGYTEEVIQLGLNVLIKYSDEEIDYVARLVVKNRGDLMFNGINAEKLLAMFPKIVPKFAA